MPTPAGIWDRLARILFGLSLVIIGVGYGIFAHSNNLFPLPLLQSAREGADSLMERSGNRLPWFYHRQTGNQGATASVTERPELTLVTGMAPNRRQAATVVDDRGRPVHRWPIDLFELWPDPSHLPPALRPKERPGALIHGTVLMPNGDLVFNFERLGMIRLDICGGVV